MNHVVLQKIITQTVKYKHLKAVWVALLSIFLLLSNYNSLFSQNNFRQKEGISFIHLNDIRIARDMAIKDALTNAVIDVVEDIMMPLTFAVDREMLEERYGYSPKDFIREFRILSEKREGNVFKVIIKAVVVRNLLEEDLSDIGLSLGLASFPRILIMIREINRTNGTKSFWWTHDDSLTNGVVSETFAAELGGSNFDVIDPLNPSYKNGIFDPDLLRYSLATNEIKEWGVIYGADLIIFGESIVSSLGDFLTPSEGIFKVSTDVKIIDVFTEEEIFSVSVQNSFISDKGEEEFGSTLKGFSKEVAKGFIEKLIAIRKEESMSTNSIEVLLRGINNYGSYIAFKEALMEMDGWVDTLQEKRFSRGEVLMEIKIKGDPFLFKEELRSLDLKIATFSVSSFSRDKIFLTMIPK